MARMSPDTLNGKRNCHCQYLSCFCTLSLLVSDILLSVLLILPSLCLFLAFLIGSGDVGGGSNTYSVFEASYLFSFVFSFNMSAPLCIYVPDLVNDLWIISKILQSCSVEGNRSFLLNIEKVE